MSVVELVFGDLHDRSAQRLTAERTGSFELLLVASFTHGLAAALVELVVVEILATALAAQALHMPRPATSYHAALDRVVAVHTLGHELVHKVLAAIRQTSLPVVQVAAEEFRVQQREGTVNTGKA